MDYLILADELALPEYSGMTDLEASASINTEDIAIKLSIPSQEIQKYLALVDKLIPMEESVLASAVEAVRLMDLFSEFDMTDPAVEIKLTEMLAALVVDSLIDSDDEIAILAMGDDLISTGVELGLGNVQEADVAFARTL